jgi:uncharacterized membrane protein YhaH (DUF805 family)
MNFLSYRGRIGRQKYIIGLIVVSVLSAIIGFLYFFVVLSSLTLILSKAGFLAVIFMFLLGFIVSLIPVFLTSTLIIKRFHDVGKSGWWWFALLIPIYNIHLAIGLLTERGITGPNPYGEDILPANTPDDIFNRFSQNNAARLIADVLIVGLWLLILVFGFVSKVQQLTTQQTAQQNIINQAVQFAACGDSTSTPDQLITPDKTWKIYAFVPSVVNGLPTNSFGKFSFQYPTTLDNGNIKNIHLATTPQDFVGIITDSQNINISGLVGVYVNVFATNGRSPEDILSTGEGFSGRIYDTKDFKTNSGITGKEMTIRFNNPSVCGGYEVRARILFNLPQTQSWGEPTVIEFDMSTWALNNNFVESIAKTFTTTNVPATSSVSGSQGTNTPGKATVTTGIYPSGCYMLTYNPELLIANKDEVHEGIISFTDTKGNSVFDATPSLLGEVGAVATQTVSQFNPKPSVKDFVTTSGVKGKEIVGSNFWEILIPTASQQNGDTIILSIGSFNLNNLKSGEVVARSFDTPSSCAQ